MNWQAQQLLFRLLIMILWRVGSCDRRAEELIQETKMWLKEQG